MEKIRAEGVILGGVVGLLTGGTGRFRRFRRRHQPRILYQFITSAKLILHNWRGQKIAIDMEKDQPVWTDGEYTGCTPVSMEVIQGGLTVAVP